MLIHTLHAILIMDSLYIIYQYFLLLIQWFLFLIPNQLQIYTFFYNIIRYDIKK